MRHFITFIAVIFISTFASNTLLAQVDTSAVLKIRAFVNYVDSLSNSDQGNEFVVNSIAEGTVTQEIVSVSIAGHSRKADTVRKIAKGGFGKYTTQNIKGDTVYKILYHDNISKNFYESYYYKDNRLVYAKIDYQENGIGQTFYCREEYYKDNEMFFVVESASPIDTVFKQRITFDLKKKGNDYFRIFQSDRDNVTQGYP